jgi:hypothetical protein
MLAGTVLLAVLVPFAGTTPMHLSTTVIAAVLGLGVAGTGAAYVLNYQLIGDEGATAASTANYLIPVVAVILGATLLGEPVYMESRTGRHHDSGCHRPLGGPATPPSPVSPPQTTSQALEACSSP